MKEVFLEIQKYLEAPFKAVLDDIGCVRNIEVGSKEPAFVVNIKRAVMSSLLPFTYSGNNMETMMNTNIITKEPEQNKISFKRMEASIVGICETEYINRKLAQHMIEELEEEEPNKVVTNSCKDQDYFEVLQTKNFQRCKQRSIFQHTYGSSSKSDGSNGASSPNVPESSLQRTILCGSLDNPLLRKSTAEGICLTSALGSLENVEKIEITSRNTLILKSIEEVTGKTLVISDATPIKLPNEIPIDEIWAPHYFLYGDSNLQDTMSSFYSGSIQDTIIQDIFVKTFIQLVEVSKKSPESSHDVEDANEKVIFLTKLALPMQYFELKNIWSMVNDKTHHDIAHKEVAQYLFLDLLSITGTQPCVKYLSEMVKGNLLSGEQAVWITSSMIKSIKTPSEEILLELTDLLKHSSVLSDKALKASIAMMLTELVHRVCVDETSKIYNYPMGIFGQLCTKDSEIIKTELLPFLKEKIHELKDELLQEDPSTEAINSALIYINALGNLGIDDASMVILKVIEGNLTKIPCSGV